MPTGLEAVAVVVTVVAVYLTAQQVVWCWPTALVSVSLYAVVFYHARLYADMGLQAVYFALSVYGWWAWLRGGADHGRLPVSVARWPQRMLLLAVGAAGGIALGAVLWRHTDASLPYVDSLLTAYSLVAQWLMARKVLDSWVLWIVVDVVYVGMFLYKGLLLTAGLYFGFIGLAVLGLVQWRRSMEPRAQEAAP